MKKLLLFAFVGLFTGQVIGQSNIEAIAVGSALPMAATKMKSVDGKQISIKDVMQKNGVLVMFSCNTCPYVIKYQGRTLEAIKEARKNEVGVIIINSNEATRTEVDSYNSMQDYAKNQQYTAPYVVDEQSKLANAFGATRTPECFLFNSKGELVYHGAIDDNQDVAGAKRKHLSEAISESINGKTISINNTKSVGCTIKRTE